MKGRAGTSKLPFRAKLFTMPLYVISYPRKTYVSTREKFATVEIHTLYVIRCKSVSLTRKQAKRASVRSQSDQTGYVVELKAPCKRTQHCWPTTPNIVGCYMLRVASYMLHVGSCCIRLHTTANTDATAPNIFGPTM